MKKQRHAVLSRPLLVSALAGIGMGLLAPTLQLSVRADVVAVWDDSANNWSSAADWSTNPNVPNNNTPPGALYDVVIGGGTLTNNVNPTIQLLNWTGGTITGGSILVLGQAAWTAGTLSGGSLTANGGFAFNGIGDATLNNSILINPLGAAATMGGGMWLHFTTGSQFTNNGSMTVTDGKFPANSAGGIYSNAGTFTLNLTNSANTFTVDNGIAFVNSGTVNIQAGTLALNGGDGGSSSGNFVLSSGTSLVLSGNFTFTPTARLSGSGALLFAGGTISLNPASDLAPTSVFSGATVTFGTTSATLAAVTISAGSVSLNSALAFSGPFTWTNGTVSGGTVTANGGITFTGSSDPVLNNSRLMNPTGAVATMGGGMWLHFTTGANFTNNGSMTVTDGKFANNSAGGVYNNTGSFTANLANPANTFTVENGIAFNNSGTVNVQTGTLAISGGDGGSTTGAFVVAGGSLVFNGIFSFAPSSIITGAGAVTFSGGTSTLAGTYNVSGTSHFSGALVNFTHPFTSLGQSLVVSGGSVSFGGQAVSIARFNLSGGQISGSAITVSGPTQWSAGTLSSGSLTANGGIDFGSSGDPVLNNSLLVNPLGAVAALSGNVFLHFTTGSQFINNGSMTVTDGRFPADSAGGIISNTGTFTVNLANPNNTFSVENGVSFNNSGTVNIQSGILALKGGDGGSTAGNFALSAGTSLSLSGAHTFSPAARISGQGTVDFNGGAISLNPASDLAATSLFSGATVTFGTGNATLAAVTINSGSVGLNSALSFTGLFTWTNGTVSGGTITANGGINFTGGHDPVLSNSLLINPPGVVSTMGGGMFLHFTTGSQFINNGSLTITDGRFPANSPGGIISNTGTFTINLTHPASPFAIENGITFNNSGTVNVQAGMLIINSAGSHTGLFSSPGSGSITFGGVQNFNAGASVAAQNLTFTGTSTFNAGSSLDTTQNFLINAGNLVLNNASTYTFDPLPHISHSSSGTDAFYSGALSLADARLVVQAADANDKSLRTAALRTAITQAAAGGNWTGSGISSPLAAADPAHLGVGLFDNAALNLSTFGGASVDANSILVAVAHLGDANRNGIVDIQDQSIVTNHWQTAQDNWASGDLNLDGFVDLQDLTLVTNNWQQSSIFSQQTVATAASLEKPAAAISSVPEPASLALLAAGTLLLGVRSRKSSRPAYRL